MRIRTASLAFLPFMLMACEATAPLETPDPLTVLAVAPAAGAVDVDPGASMLVTFSQPVADGAEAYMDVHRGGPSGETVAGHWSWSGDRRSATFVAAGPLATGALHTLHLGAGLQGRNGGTLDLDHCIGLGGQWVGGNGMSGPGNGWGPHGPGWMHQNGSWGMGFGFTTRRGPEGPGGPGASSDSATALISAVSPEPGASGVDVRTTIVIEFSAAMPDSATVLMDVHVSGFGGATVAGEWTWSDERRVATFTPGQLLLPLTRYVVHVGGGVVDADGRPLDFQHCRDALGGQWAGGTGGMGSGPHHGNGGHSGPGWQHANGSYGVVFSFTTG